jgi:hypothetical protein
MFRYNLTRIIPTLHEYVCKYAITSRLILLTMRNVPCKSCRGNQYTNFMFNNFFLENCAVYEIRKPVPVAARSKALVCGRSPAEIVG